MTSNDIYKIFYFGELSKIPQDFAAVRDNTKTYEKHMSEIGLCPVLWS